MPASKPDAALRERYAGDREDPRGGVRWILPQKATYWPWPATKSWLRSTAFACGS